MDLLDLIRTQINALPPGDHRPGMQSVLHHIETAYKRFARGQSEGDEFFFTDTIYRTNQAFEGSVKEAYRVLAGKDPSRKQPYEIERYLEKENVFRNRILGQFTNYRTEWRDPSTHDYNLNFDEAEAFLAIISVSAFTKLLADEITERLSYVTVQKDAAVRDRLQAANLRSSQPLISRVTSALADFPKYYKQMITDAPIESEAQLMGALAGFLTSVLPEAQTTTGRILRGPKTYYVDIMVTLDDQVILVELKRGDSPSLMERGVAQFFDYLSVANARHGVLFLYSDSSTEYDVTNLKGAAPGTEIHVVRSLGGLTISRND